MGTVVVECRREEEKRDNKNDIGVSHCWREHHDRSPSLVLFVISCKQRVFVFS